MATMVPLRTLPRPATLCRFATGLRLPSVVILRLHVGQRFDEVPEDYLRWIVEGRNELRKEVKASARCWLEKRVSNGTPASQVVNP